jgi:hypothetical protein
MAYLDNLVKDQWSQYSNHTGQVYYVEIATGESQYNIPTGWEDDLQVKTLFGDTIVDAHIVGITMPHTSTG